MVRKMIFIALFSMALLLGTACDDDNGPQPGVPDNSFAIGTTNYPTTNAYLLLDDGPNYLDQYGILLADTDFREDNVNGISMNTNGKHAVVLWVNNSSTLFTNEQDVMISIGTHVLDEESTAIYDIIQFEDTYPLGTDTYGEPSENGASVVEAGSSGGGNVTINSVTVDYTARTAQLDISYTLTNGVVSLNGQFIGNAGLLNGF
ncbi:hypothetical protein [Lewinella sp. LCG006]|uniref:hypothetical protein n=1 Tax=Lewinella sp. LCG006 TaxID=3231911 RepID=UPI00345F438B